MTRETILLLSLFPLAFVLGFAWGFRRGIRKNLRLYLETLQVIGLMLKDQDKATVQEFIKELVRD